MVWIADLTDNTRSVRGVLVWAYALVAFAICFAMRFALGPLLGQEEFLASFLAITLTAFFFGWQPAALVFVLSLGSMYYFFLPPPWSLRLVGAPAYVALAGCAALGAFHIALIDALVIAMRRLRSAARMQEMLFRELQHRVANNMQMLVAMLDRGLYGPDDASTTEILDHARARITTMAQLHRRLHDPNAYTNGLTPLLRDLLAELFQGLEVSVTVDMCNDALSLSQLTSITLLVNEAAMNAAKHVFRPKLGAVFQVMLTDRGDGRLRLIIHDDGPGIAEAADKSLRTEKLGVTIMEAFAQRLGGALTVKGFPGTTLSIDFAPMRDELPVAI